MMRDKKNIGSPSSVFQRRWRERERERESGTWEYVSGTRGATRAKRHTGSNVEALARCATGALANAVKPMGRDKKHRLSQLRLSVTVWRERESGSDGGSGSYGASERGTGNINWFCLNRIMREVQGERPREIVNWRLDERTDLASLWCQSPQWRISPLSLQLRRRRQPGMKWSVRIRRTFEKLPERIELRSCSLL